MVIKPQTAEKLRKQKENAANQHTAEKLPCDNKLTQPTKAIEARPRTESGTFIPTSGNKLPEVVSSEPAYTFHKKTPYNAL